MKANNDGLATAVLSIKMKYSQDRPRILKRQPCLPCQALFSNYSQEYRKSDNSLLNTMQFGKTLFFSPNGNEVKDDAKLNNNYSNALSTYLCANNFFFDTKDSMA